MKFNSSETMKRISWLYIFYQILTMSSSILGPASVIAGACMISVQQNIALLLVHFHEQAKPILEPCVIRVDHRRSHWLFLELPGSFCNIPSLMTECTCSTNPTTMSLQTCRNNDYASFPTTFQFVKSRVRSQIALHTALSAMYQTQQTNNHHRHFENPICIPHDRIVAM